MRIRPVSLVSLVFVASVVLMAVLGLAAFAAAQEPAGGTASFTERLMTTSRTRASFPSVHATRSLRVGEGKTSFYWAGITGKSLVVGSGSQLVPPSPPTTAPAITRVQWLYLWRVQLTLLAQTIDAITLDIDWNRYEMVNDSPQPLAGDKRTVVLKSGERYVLDVLDLSSRDLDVTNALIEIEFPRDDQPRAEYANASLSYDLWLVHETAGGQKFVRNVRLSGRDGQSVPFTFAPLAFPIDAGVQADGNEGLLKILMEGTIKSRIRADGAIDVVLQSSRTLQCHPGLRAVEGGSKSVTAKPGETVGVELPWLVMGFCPAPEGTAMPARPRPGVVTGEDGRLRVNFKDFFAGDKTSILLTVRKQG